MIDTAGTLCAGAQAVKEAGATRIVACATHPLFSGPRWSGSRPARSTRSSSATRCRSIPTCRSPTRCASCRSTRILAETIAEIFHHGSVSQIFGGENQLF